MEYGGANCLYPVTLFQGCSTFLYDRDVSQFLHAGDWSLVASCFCKVAFNLLPGRHDVDLSTHTQILPDLRLVGFSYAVDRHTISRNDLDISIKVLAGRDR